MEGRLIFRENFDMSYTTCKTAGCSTEIKSDDPTGLCRLCLKIALFERFSPREWQDLAAERVSGRSDPFSLISACPGAGKTAFTGYMASQWVLPGRPQTLFGKSDKWKLVIVVPTEHLKNQWAAELYSLFGMNLYTRINAATGVVGSNYDGYILTYQQLPGVVHKFEQWHKHGVRFITAADELHHCGRQNSWGDAVHRLGVVSEKVVGLSGTPWRSDGAPIPFVQLDKENNTVPDFKYTYSQAIADKDPVCRPVVFKRVDADVSVFDINSGDDLRASWSNPNLEKDTGKKESWWIAKGLDESGETISRMVSAAVEELFKMRSLGAEYRDAAGGVHCLSKTSGYLSGEDDIEADDPRFMHHVHNLIVRSGCHSTKVGAHIDKSSEIISNFSKRGGGDFLCSIRKVSEGIDIKRLMVGLYATNVTTLLYFIQLVGRYVRWNKNLPAGQTGLIIIPNTPEISRFADDIESEVRAGMAMRESRKPPIGPPGEPTGTPSLWVTKESIPTMDGAFYRGQDLPENDPDYILAQQMVKDGKSHGLPAERLACLLRDAEAGRGKNRQTPSADDYSIINLGPTEEQKCNALIADIKKLIAAVTKKVKGYEEYNRVHHHLNVEQRVPKGVKNGQQWVRETLGAAGLEARLRILQEILKDNARRGVAQ